MSQIRVIAGLGNPGSRYEETRHNAGFLIVNALVEWCLRGGGSQGLGFGLAASGWRIKNEAEYAEIRLGGEALHVIKPLGYMNCSGEAVGALLRFYKYEADGLLVVHDDIDLPLGSLRVKKGGGEAGHNGLRSVTEHLGTKDYYRLRIGVGKPEHREDENAVAQYVLSRFSADERQVLDGVIVRARDAIVDLCMHGLCSAQNRHNG